MTRYIAFFGSVNVGDNRLTMADLRHAMAREEFENIETVVASGNVLFDYDQRPTDGLEDMLSHMMADRFDIASFVAVRSVDELRSAIEDNPFAATGDPAQVHTMFLAGDPGALTFSAMAEIHAPRGPERLALGARCLYIDYVEGVGRSRLTNAFIERRLGYPGTARNIRSLRRILDKMEH
ncbi:DUF1697 domain-containing protein [Novosphingobium sp. FSY-8]|uniref:DUF1697 domain-containing protein n=1 Tax=Novosphingobium ovatum TaxID=1908523 RepID=A0ABW9XAD9_9SPHN|nr:DUF1697 domain-containing protein [Novosphingobium ovatum]NBC35500.1 DUF1697 domain-containing protein [Novosphingobium ovatum]